MSGKETYDYDWMLQKLKDEFFYQKCTEVREGINSVAVSDISGCKLDSFVYAAVPVTVNKRPKRFAPPKTHEEIRALKKQ